VLAYLDALIDALAIRDTTEVLRLLAHPLSRILPATVREEAEAMAQGRCDALAAPLRTMQLRHQTAELLRETPPVADVADVGDPAVAVPTEVADAPRARRTHPPARAHRPSRLVQMELPLSA
jgi:hypothetical protein